MGCIISQRYLSKPRNYLLMSVSMESDWFQACSDIFPFHKMEVKDAVISFD